MGDDVGDLGRFAGIGDDDDHIALGHHAQIAVAGLGRVNELRGRAGAGEGRGDLASDMARFAHAGHDHPAARGQNGFDRPVKAVAQADGQRGQAFGLGCDDAAGGIEIGAHAR